MWPVILDVPQCTVKKKGKIMFLQFFLKKPNSADRWIERANRSVCIHSHNLPEWSKCETGIEAVIHWMIEGRKSKEFKSKRIETDDWNGRRPRDCVPQRFSSWLRYKRNPRTESAEQISLEKNVFSRKSVAVSTPITVLDRVPPCVDEPRMEFVTVIFPRSYE